MGHPISLRGLEMPEEGFYPVEVFFGVYAYCVVVGGFDLDGDVVFEEAELFETLDLLEGAGG